jgi:1,4-dihydroxy-2-naphthoate octaprenyltransferase
MVSRSDILMLGIGAGASGGLIGGLMLGIGMSLIVQGANIGWLLLLPAAPVSALIGWIMARRLAKDLPPG